MQLSTVFTILFAATTGRSVKSFAMWLLQRGCSIETLDRLFGSTTVGGVVLTNSALGIPRAFITYALITALLCLWTVSPLASQAVLRIMSIRPDVATRQMNRAYMNITDWGALPGAGSDGTQMVIAPNTVMNAALIAPMSTKDLPRDLWGNVKIPLLSSLQGDMTDDGWRDVKHDGFATYSSLVGLPIAMPIAGAADTSASSANMSVESWYWDMNCSIQQWTLGTTTTGDYRRQWDAYFPYNWTSTIYSASPPISIYVHELGVTRAGDFCNVPCPSTGIDRTVFCPGLPARELGIILDNMGSNVYGICTLKTIYVETEVLCDGNGCRAVRARQRLTPDLPPPEWTVLDICYNSSANWHPLGRYFDNLSNSIQSRRGGSGGRNALVGFILDPTDAFSAPKTRLIDQPPDIITKRLTQVLNSYWMSSLSSSLTTGDWGDNFQSFRGVGQQYLGDQNISLLRNSTATIYDEYNVFTCNLGWLAAFTISTLIALITSISGLVFVVSGSGPRLAMNVTTMLRDSTWVQLPFVTSYMGDAGRSRRTGHTRVILGDVAPGSEVGHIAIAQEHEEFEVERLRKDRVYD